MAVEPRETDLLWPDPKKGPWWIKIWWRVQHGVPTPVGISLRSWVNHDESRMAAQHNALPLATEDAELPRIDGTLMRTLPVGGIIDDCRRQLAGRLNREVDETWPEEWKRNLEQWRTETADERDAVNSGRRGRDLGDDHYREVAEVYAAAVQAGDPPTVAVRDHFTVTKSAAAKKVARARERGFLPETTRGRVGPLSKEI